MQLARSPRPEFMHRSLIASKPPLDAHRFSSAAGLRTFSDDWLPLSAANPQISSGGIPDVFSGGGGPFGQSEIVSIYGVSFGPDLGFGPDLRLISTLGGSSCILLASVASYRWAAALYAMPEEMPNGHYHE